MRIFEYSAAGVHPSVARALYNGQLFLSDRPELGIHHDFEFHNGALYTHWGYGVPLLQMPFHLLATAFSSGPGFHPFPDRAIFLFYLLLGTALFWLALRSLLERAFGLGEGAGSALATTSTAFLLTYGLYWLVSMYFGVYEATVAYLALVEFSALSFFVLFHLERRAGLLLALGATEGIGILVRPTGVLYVGLFLFLLCLSGGRRRHAVGLYVVSALPFAVAWAALNYARTDTLLGTGLNTVLSEPGEMHAFQFGANPCFASLGDSLRLLGYYLAAVFSPWMSGSIKELAQSCGLGTAELARQPLPLVSPVVSLALVCVISSEIPRRNYAVLGPIGMTMGVIGFFVRSGLNLGARYMGDLWPAFCLLLLTPLLRLEGLAPRPKWVAVASVVLLALSARRIATGVIPQFATIRAAERAEDAFVPPGNFKRERVAVANAAPRTFQWTEVPFKPNPMNGVPTYKACPPYAISQFEMDAYGWTPDCRTWAITPMFLSLPEKPGGEFTLQIDYALLRPTPLEPGRTLEVTVNGARYSAAFDGIHAAIPFRIRKDRLHSPVVPVVIRWEKSFSHSDVLLERVEIR
ncbi:MAG TPA: hypothetical protein VER78_05920 [Thermoanaerobaculia bacterium]|nr:hypothetical protein [Thermoanaerobaculia bacterium]